MAALTGTVPGNNTNTLSYTIPAAGLAVESVYVAIDGSGAAGLFTAELTIADQSGQVIAKRVQTDTLNNTGAVSATWAVRLDSGGGSGSGTVADITSVDGSITVTNPTGPTVDLAIGQGGLVWFGITTVTLGVAGTFDIQNIPQTYRDLVIDISARGTNLTNLEVVGMRFNNDSGSNHYSWANGNFSSGSSTGTASGGDQWMQVAQIPGPGADAGHFGDAQIRVSSYRNTSFQRTCASYGYGDLGSGGVARSWVDGGSWRDTSAVNRIQLFGINQGGVAAVTNLAAGSTVRLYGML